MFELDFPPPHLVDERHLARMRQIIADILASKQQASNRAANQTFIDGIKLRARVEYNEGYWREALDYHLGLLYAHVGDPERAAYHFDRSGTYPGQGGNQLFTDHQHDSLELFERQTRARERGIPSPLIASMPRSASASLTQTLAAMFDAPHMRISCGRFPVFCIVPRWLNCFSPGGAMLHDHFSAVPFNLKTLREGNVRQVFVRARDPRAAAASAVNLYNRIHGAPTDVDFETQAVDLCEKEFIPWLVGWLGVAADETSGLKVHWLNQPSNAITEMVRDVLTVLVPQYPALEPYLAANVAEVKANYVTGDNEAWRRTISAAGQQRLWSAVPPSVKDLLALEC